VYPGTFIIGGQNRTYVKKEVTSPPKSKNRDLHRINGNLHLSMTAEESGGSSAKGSGLLPFNERDGPLTRRNSTGAELINQNMKNSPQKSNRRRTFDPTSPPKRGRQEKIKPRVTLQSQASHTNWLSDRQSLERKPGTVFRASSAGPPSTGTGPPIPRRVTTVPQKAGVNPVQLIKKTKEKADSLKTLANKELKAHVLIVNKWLLDAIQDMGRASTILGQVFMCMLIYIYISMHVYKSIYS
jgi:hypothetical protein